MKTSSIIFAFLVWLVVIFLYLPIRNVSIELKNMNNKIDKAIKLLDLELDLNPEHEQIEERK